MIPVETSLSDSQRARSEIEGNPYRCIRSRTFTIVYL